MNLLKVLKQYFLFLTVFFISSSILLANTNTEHSQNHYKTEYKADRQAKLFKKLALSPDQISKIKTQQSQTQNQRRTLHAEIKNLEKALSQNISSNPNNIDTNTVKDIKIQLDTQRSKLSQLNLDAKIYFNQILTAEQREKLKKMKAKKESRRSKYKKRSKRY